MADSRARHRLLGLEGNLKLCCLQTGPGLCPTFSLVAPLVAFGSKRALMSVTSPAMHFGRGSGNGQGLGYFCGQQSLILFARVRVG